MLLETKRKTSQILDEEMERKGVEEGQRMIESNGYYDAGYHQVLCSLSRTELLIKIPDLIFL